jgi:hypothetical protein
VVSLVLRKFPFDLRLPSEKDKNSSRLRVIVR